MVVQFLENVLVHPKPKLGFGQGLCHLKLDGDVGEGQGLWLCEVGNIARWSRDVLLEMDNEDHTSS